MTVYHVHHIIPKHAGGENGPTIRLPIEEHAEEHKKLYEETGNEYDRIAWLTLSGQITNAEANYLTSVEQGKRNAKKQIIDGTHPFLGGEIQRKAAKKRLADGTHNFLGPQSAKQRVIDGTHPFLDRERQRKNALKKVANGTHPFQHHKLYVCSECGRTIKGTSQYSSHLAAHRKHHNDQTIPRG